MWLAGDSPGLQLLACVIINSSALALKGIRVLM